MSISGLLSLNVHESLTLETEVAINPDIFNDFQTPASSVTGSAVVAARQTIMGSAASSRTTTAHPSTVSVASPSTTGHHHPLATHERTLSEATLSPGPPISDRKQSHDSATIGSATSFNNHNNINNNNNTNSNRLLEPGDVIEIRVWDPKNPGQTITSHHNYEHHHAPTHRRKPSSSFTLQDLIAQQQLLPPTSTAAPADSTPKRQTKPIISSPTTTTTNQMPDSPSFKANPGTTPSKSPSGAASLQYSIDSSSDRSDASSVETATENKGTTTTTAPLKGGNIPPISSNANPTTLSPRGELSPKADSKSSNHNNIMRSRTHTISHASDLPLHNRQAGKPPLIHRIKTVGSAPTNESQFPRGGGINTKPLSAAAATTTTTTSTTTSLTASSKLLPKPFHSRDISEMTIETVLGASRDSHDIDIIQSLDSADDCSTLPENIISKVSQTHNLRLSLVMLITEQSLTSLKGGTSRSQISILRQVADLYGLSHYDMVTVTRIDKSEEPDIVDSVSADFVVLTFKDQFISRGDMHIFQKSLIGRWIYEGERLHDSSIQGIKAHAWEIRHANNQLSKSGIITEDTKITFRSRSTRIIWLVQISSEMWDYASPYMEENTINGESICELVFDKFVRFMYKLFRKWKAYEVTHSLTVVFFSRTLIANTQQNSSAHHHQHTPNKDVYGRLFEDHYKTIIENETPTDWESLVVRIKREFVKYPFDVGWDLTSERYKRPSTAMQGNLLEALNTTLNLLQFHFLDRDTHRTGNSIVVVSPECGVFEVDKTLAEITKQRMMDNGIGSDMLSLGLPPLHIAPYFLYNDVYRDDGKTAESDTVFSEVPHWMHLSFVSYDDADDIELPFYESEGEEDELHIAPNGFLVPEVTARPLHRDSSYLAHPVVRNYGARSLSKSQTQQRQLISGRNFREILDACRPRTSSYQVPSALKNLLWLRSTVVGGEKGGQHVPKESHVQDGRLVLKEWGAVSFDKAQLNSSFVGSPRSIQRALSPARFENERMLSRSGRSSPSSSFPNRLSSSILLGRSMERGAQSPALVNSNPSRTRTSLHIQRSPSLEFDQDMLATVYGDTDEAQDVDIDQFMKMMTDHDNRCARLVQTPANAHDLLGVASSPPTVIQGGALVTPPASSSDGVESTDPGGGIGAALKRYNSDDLEGPVTRDRRFFGSARRSESPTQALKSVSSRDSSQRPSSDPPDIIQGSPQLMQSYLRSSQPRTAARLSSSSGPIAALGTSFERRRRLMVRPIPVSSLANTPRAKAQSPPGLRRESQIPVASSTGHSREARRRSRSRTRRSSRHETKKKNVVNPFRQQDEDDELELKSHNRRRWSHVFPPGELEFKRHAGPQWESLCQPAVLPLTIDFFPSPEELRDETCYTFTPYDLTLQGLENKHYATHSQLLMEMARQRVTQDFQVVPPAVLWESGAVKKGEIQHTLSMGHKIHILSYDADSDKITVELFTSTTKDARKVYRYLMYVPSTRSYCPVVQTFEKYSKPYLWNKMDHVILDDVEWEGLSERNRCRRIQFGIMPPSLESDESENEYIEKFERLVEYLGRLHSTDGAEPTLVIAIRKRVDEGVAFEKMPSKRKLVIQLNKGKKDMYEWLELSIDSCLSTTSSYRIVFNWLVASTSKVETQIQALQRRCTQFGLCLLPFPQLPSSENLFLNPFIVPELLTIRKPNKLDDIVNMLLAEDFITDGMYKTDPSFLTTVTDYHEFSFPLKRFQRERNGKEIRNIDGRQFVHRPSASVFVRLLVDKQSWLIAILYLNHKVTKDKEEVRSTAVRLTEKLRKFVTAMVVH